MGQNRQLPVRIKCGITSKQQEIRDYVNKQWVWNWGLSFRLRQQNLCKRRLAKNSRWRHIRLAIKPCYLGNQASRIKNYYGTLSRSLFHNLSRKKVRAAPPGRGLIMTSHPACNKTSLSRKPCIAYNKLRYINISKSWSIFHNSSWKTACAVHCPLLDDWWWRHIRFAINPWYLGNHTLQKKRYYGSLSGSHGRSSRICYKNRLKCPCRRNYVDVTFGLQ